MLTKYETDYDARSKLERAVDLMQNLPALYQATFVEDMEEWIGADIKLSAPELLHLISTGSALDLLNLIVDGDATYMITERINEYNWEFELSETEAEPGAD